MRPDIVPKGVFFLRARNSAILYIVLLPVYIFWSVFWIRRVISFFAVANIKTMYAAKFQK